MDCLVAVVWHNSQKNTSARVYFMKKKTVTQVFSCKFYEIYENTFFDRIPPVAAADCCLTRINICLETILLIYIFLAFLRKLICAKCISQSPFFPFLSKQQ